MMSGFGLEDSIHWITDIGEYFSAALEATIECGGIAAGCSLAMHCPLQCCSCDYCTTLP